jgi:hypothetical protein
MSGHVRPSDSRLDQLASIERLLDQYRDTKDREFLRQAIMLWDEVQADRARLAIVGRQQTH